jgi:hypothetical protein
MVYPSTEIVSPNRVNEIIPPLYFALSFLGNRLAGQMKWARLIICVDIQNELNIDFVKYLYSMITGMQKSSILYAL